jgi:Insect pheromone-binding family, A10/OS-D
MPKFAFYCCYIAILCLGIASCEETYDIKYDNVDIDEILKSERLLSNYINCLLEEGPCTEDGRELKDNLPDAIQTDCSKCTEKQKMGSDKIMHFM